MKCFVISGSNLYVRGMVPYHSMSITEANKKFNIFGVYVSNCSSGSTSNMTYILLD